MLPTYNEAENIVDVLEQVREAAARRRHPRRRRRQPRRHRRPGRAAGRPTSAQIEILRRPEKRGPRRRLPRRLRVGPRPGLRRPRRDGRRPVARPRPCCPPCSHAVEDGADLAIGSRYVPRRRRPGLAAATAGSSPGRATGYARSMLAPAVPRRDGRLPGLPARRSCARSTSTPRGRRLRLPDRDGLPQPPARGEHRRDPDHFPRPGPGMSKMSLRIVGEALTLVTVWGVRDRLRALRGLRGLASRRAR